MEAKRQARPLMADDLRALVETLRPLIPAEARDAALLAVGWAAALRRSELIGLDWQSRGTGTGFVRLDERGLVVTLMASKRPRIRPRQLSCHVPICQQHAKPSRSGQVSRL
jgi:integrase